MAAQKNSKLQNRPTTVRVGQAFALPLFRILLLSGHDDPQATHPDPTPPSASHALGSSRPWSCKNPKLGVKCISTVHAWVCKSHPCRDIFQASFRPPILLKHTVAVNSFPDSPCAHEKCSGCCLQSLRQVKKTSNSSFTQSNNALESKVITRAIYLPDTKSPLQQCMYKASSSLSSSAHFCLSFFGREGRVSIFLPGNDAACMEARLPAAKALMKASVQIFHSLSSSSFQGKSVKV